MPEYIPYGRQSINQADIDEVCNVLKSDWLTQGPVIPKFENAVATYCGASYGIAVSSATAALHLACLAIGLGPGDYLWTSANTFVASANCALYCGAKVDFIDINLETYNICVDALEAKLIAAEKVGKLPKVIVAVHFAGQSCAMQQIKILSNKYGFRIIEDASHAIGGAYQGRKIGCCDYSDITIFSFHPVKIITTGEGGVILTNHQNLYEKLIRLRTHGITRENSLMVGEVDGPWCYQQIELGFNYRMTDIQASLGISQMHRLDEYIDHRNEIVRNYNAVFSTFPIITPKEMTNCNSAWHLYVILIDDQKTSIDRLTVFKKLRAANIGVNVHYIPVYKQPYYQKNGFESMLLPNVEYYYQRAITLPLFPDLSIKDQNYVTTTLGTVLQ